MLEAENDQLKETIELLEYTISHLEVPISEHFTDFENISEQSFNVRKEISNKGAEEFDALEVEDMFDFLDLWVTNKKGEKRKLYSIFMSLENEEKEKLDNFMNTE